MIKDHFMLHKSDKSAILESYEKDKFKLMWTMLGIGNLVENSKTILLIADYYGEK